MEQRVPLAEQCHNVRANQALTSASSSRSQPCQRPEGGTTPVLEALLTSKEAAQILRIHPKVLERMAKRGEVPALKVGKFWRYRATVLDSWINSKLLVAHQPNCMRPAF